MAVWLTDKFIYLMLAGLPVFFSGAGYSGITAAKHGFFMWATLIWLALSILSTVFEAVRFKRAAFIKRRISPAQYFVIAFLLVSVISAVFSDFPFSQVWGGTGRYDGLFTTLLYGAIFLGVSFWGRRKDSYVYAFALAMLVSCCVAVLQLLGYNPLSLYPEGYDYFGGGVIYSGSYLGLSGNVDIMAALFSPAIPLFFGTYLAKSGKLGAAWLAFLLVSGGLCLFVLLMSGAEAGLVAIFGSLVLSAPVFVISGSKKIKHPKRFAAAYSAAVLICALAGLIAVYNTGAESGTAYELSRILRGELSESFGSSRIRIWRETLSLIPEHPLLGGGPGTLAARLKIEFARYVPETGKTLKSFVDNAHNEYLAHLANTGILGLAAYLTALICSARSFFSGRIEKERAVYGAAILACCIEAFFGLGLCLSAPLFWLIWGLFESETPDVLSKPSVGTNP